MRIHLIGADFEENLGLGMIAAVAEEAGHAVEVLPFNDGGQLSRLAARVVAAAPEVVGLGIQFQHRSHDFLALAWELRRRGYAGHITCGGQFPSIAWREVLEADWGVDSVVLYEGERTVPELLAALAERRPLAGVAGLALRGEGGVAQRTPERSQETELDQLPFPRRYRSHSRHVGVPFIPILGSRGCWGRCSFCSISAVHRDAREHAGARLLRHRSPENLAAEMAVLTEAAGGSAVFCFHDDTFLLPRPADSLARVKALRAALDAEGVGPAGLIGKCRPDSLTPELARELRRLGVVRLYVGVENVSPAGSAHLDRRLEVARVHAALDACREAGIFSCYNLLLFEPDATLADVEENIACIRRHAGQPVNFCRAEAYCGTPLQQQLEEAGQLGGSYLGYDYRISDDQVELLFRVCAAAFRERNFATNGVHNRYMGLGYYAKLLEHFFDDPVGVAAVAREAEALTRAIALETAGFLDEAVALVRAHGGKDREAVERETALLALRISEADRAQHSRLDAVYALISGFAETTPRLQPPVAPRARTGLARRLAGVGLGVWLAASGLAPAGCSSRAAPTDAGVDGKKKVDGGTDGTVVDMVPPDGWIKKKDGMVVDPAPRDAGRDAPKKKDGTVVDMVPPDGMIVDPPPPPDGTVVDMVPPDKGASLLPTGEPTLAGAGHYRDLTPQRPPRSRDLPFFDPPQVWLQAAREASGVRVCAVGGPEAVSLRWQCAGTVEGDGREVLWHPADEEDQLSLGVRGSGGVAVVSVRVKDLAG